MMKKTFFSLFLFCVVALFAAATETKAQEPVSQSERRTVIKALETKIAELEVKRAMQLPDFAPTGINIQLANLRKRLAELTGKRTTTARRPVNAAAVGQNGKAPEPKKSLQLTDSPPMLRVLY